MDIGSFPLAWRWTSKAHTVLPQEVLRGLRPLAPETAKEMFSKVPKRLGADALIFQATDTEATKEWLQSLPITASEVTLVWNDTTALTLPWSTFVRYWSDFCYPSSDDVVLVVPGQGIIRWHHYERFEYWA